MMRRTHTPQAVKIYRVGGSVRDELLGRAVADRDWVVIGATPEILVASGYKPVGRDFPVFLHRDTGEEYALARTERKHGRGYHGFEFFASPDVTLAEDLARRDLTINAMARDDQGKLIDLFGGESDLRAGILRHVSPAFVEDPLRVLRVARFAARFGFIVAPETLALMQKLVASGELAALLPERAWQELSRGLMERHPARMLAVLRDCKALGRLLPEVDALYGGAPVIGSGDDDAGASLARALECAALREYELPVRYGVVAGALGNAQSSLATDSAQRVPATRGVRLTEAMSSRLKVPTACRNAGRLAARWRATVDRARALHPMKLLDLLTAADALRRPKQLDALLKACECSAVSRTGAPAGYAPAPLLRDALTVIKKVDAGAVARAAAVSREPAVGDAADRIQKAVRAARLAALRHWRATLPKTIAKPSAKKSARIKSDR